ncbi:uncharacterized protein V1510DRAFT_426335 [Dipodascopsis tothii]|uniref:uncharacterized protein n=1 Tax=Dipodascopsis tothii TaxID=44089 RepID=UPI0034CFB772
MKIAFIHPDLGIGGAERLVVDAAVGLQDRGHEVTVFTSRCDRNHCFEECRDGTLRVVVEGYQLVPANIGGRFAIVCAILRQLHLTLYLLRHYPNAFDCFVVDQLSFCVPLLRAFTSAKTLFYGHFPDQLLASRSSALRRLYRLPFDWAEEATTRQADVLVVNSKFTRGVFARAFPRLAKTPEVVYPCVDVTAADAADYSTEVVNYFREKDKRVVLSINRFERKKDIDLAVKAFAGLKRRPDFPKAMLVVAGGYDTAVRENVEYLKELHALCDRLGLSHATCFNVDTASPAPFGTRASTAVLFLPSVSTPVKASLLMAASLLAYTPTNEHFGIVPLEAMLYRVPVLATNTGGPLETVRDPKDYPQRHSGWLRPAADVDAWTDVMARVFGTRAQAAQLAAAGDVGRDTVIQNFSKESMAERFEKILDAAERGPDLDSGLYMLAGSLVLVAAILVYIVWFV